MESIIVAKALKEVTRRRCSANLCRYCQWQQYSESRDVQRQLNRQVECQLDQHYRSCLDFRDKTVGFPLLHALAVNSSDSPAHLPSLLQRQCRRTLADRPRKADSVEPLKFGILFHHCGPFIRWRVARPDGSAAAIHEYA
jgi:hypothetical protein